MAAMPQEPLVGLGVLGQATGSSYRSPCLMYAAPFPTPLGPPPSASLLSNSAGLGANNCTLDNVLAPGGPLLAPGGPAVARRTVAATSSVATTSVTDQSTNPSTGDYQVHAGELIPSPHSHYEVLELLGRGTFGQVLKCWKKDSNEVVAMKILKNLPSYSKQGQVEVDVLTTLSKVNAQQFNFVRAYESFVHLDHICIVFELLNINLYDYLKQNHFQPLPLQHIRPVAQQVLMCLKKLKELGLVHADLKPENIMLVDPVRQPFRVKVIDFGSATVRSSSVASTYLQSRYYRAPEVILGVAYDEAIDMWSLGCVLAELFLGWPLFPGATEYDQMLYITQMLGPPPTSLTKNVAKMSRFFRKDVTGTRWELKPQILVKLETGVSSKDMRKFIFTSVSALSQVTSSSSSLAGGPHTVNVTQADLLDRAQFISLLEALLTFDPQTRATPDFCLQHSFVTMLHLSSLTEVTCVKEWIQSMQVCCQSRTTYSSPPAPQHLHLAAHPPTASQNLATPIHHTPALATSSTDVASHSNQYLPLPPSHFAALGAPTMNSTHLLVTTPTTSAMLVDTGYVSAESSPTSVWDLSKPAAVGYPYPSSVLLPMPTLTAGPAPTLPVQALTAAPAPPLPLQALTAAPAPPAPPLPVQALTAAPAPPPSLYVPTASATTYWLMLQHQHNTYNTHSRL